MPTSRQMHDLQELTEKVQKIIGKYEERLTSAGVKITVYKRYFETEVEERRTYSPSVKLFNLIDYYLDKKRERKYKNERNKYHCMILSVVPIEKSLLPKVSCKEYAFVYRKVERAHIGREPQRITYEEEKFLRKIEKRILKIIKNAEHHGVQKTCMDTVLDAIRYCSSSKYAYKGKVLGKERSSWGLIFTIGIVILAAVVVMASWGIRSLF